MKLHHYGIFTNNPVRLVSFYEKVLRFKRLRHSRLGKGIIRRIFGIDKDCDMGLFACGGVILEIFWFKGRSLSANTTRISGVSHVAIEVKDKKRFCRSLAKKIGKRRIIEVDRGDKFTYFIKDPDGNLIEVVEPLKPS